MSSSRQIVLRQYPSSLTSPSEINPSIIYARPAPTLIPAAQTTAIIPQPTTTRMIVPTGGAPIIQPAKVIRIEEDDARSLDSNYSNSSTDKKYRKLLSGFHPYYDKETDILALQCCTCCVGCWRRISTRCTGCENFISCPIYCWLLFILPVFILLVCALVVNSVYAAHWFG